jgi:hypothetical protein
MRINVPLLPLAIEITWRSLRPFRFTLRGLLMAVGIAAAFFTLVAYLRRANQAIQYHTLAAREASRSLGPFRNSTPPWANSLEQWHYRMAFHCRVIAERLDLICFLVVVLIAFIALLAIVGQFLNWFAPRSEVPVRAPNQSARLN